MKKSINHYQIGRAGYEKDKKRMFAEKTNSMKQIKNRSKNKERKRTWQG